MNEDNIFKYGSFDLDAKDLLKFIQTNFDSYIKYKGYTDKELEDFRNAVNYLRDEIGKGTLSMDGLGTTTHSTGAINDSHLEAARYIDKIANGMTKFSKKKKEQKEETPTLEKFDFGKHNFAAFFKNKNNKYAEKLTSDDLDIWRNLFATNEEAIKAFSDMLSEYREYVSKYDFTDAPDEQRKINDLIESLSDNSINGVDANNFNNLGLRNWENLFKLGVVEQPKNALTTKEPQEPQLVEDTDKENAKEKKQSDFTSGKSYASEASLRNDFNNLFATYLNNKGIKPIKNYLGALDTTWLYKQDEYNDLYNQFKNNNSVTSVGDSILGFFEGIANWFNSLYLKPINKKILPHAYELGGVLKAQLGDKIPEWYKKIYGNRTALINWHPELNKEEWKQTNEQFHGHDANTLKTVFEANQAYTSKKENVGADLNTYYQAGKYNDLQDYVNQYNDNAEKIRLYWAVDHTYGDEAAAHNTLFKDMFASRSLTEGGNPEFNIGYQKDIEGKAGSSTWHRRMDRYEKEFDLLTNEEKKSRIHEITLIDGTKGYVYKKANGDIAILSNEELSAINVPAQKPEPQNSEKPQEGLPGSITDNERNKALTPTGEPLKNPNQPSLFNTDTALSALNYYRALKHNKKLLDLANELQPTLYDPVGHHRSIYGNLRAIIEGQKAAAGLESRASNPLTSDASLQTAAQMDAYNQGLQYVQQGLKADDEMMRLTSEAAWQQEKENKNMRHQVAMKNRENMALITKEKLMAKLARLRSDYESGTNFINEIRTKLQGILDKKDAAQEAIYTRALLQDINQNPLNYITGMTTALKELWQRGLSNQLTTEEEKAEFRQLQELATNALYLTKYGNSSYDLANVRNIFNSWNPTYNLSTTAIKKQGGKLTKDLVKVIIDFLKESNKNYNKAIDRSVKGLYNHIKLLRKK